MLYKSLSEVRIAAMLWRPEGEAARWAACDLAGAVLARRSDVLAADSVPALLAALEDAVGAARTVMHTHGPGAASLAVVAQWLLHIRDTACCEAHIEQAIGGAADELSAVVDCIRDGLGA